MNNNIENKNKYAAQERWEKRTGHISKSYKLNKQIVDDFATACRYAGISQVSKLTELMLSFITEEKNKQKNGQ